MVIFLLADIVAGRAVVVNRAVGAVAGVVEIVPDIVRRTAGERPGSAAGAGAAAVLVLVTAGSADFNPTVLGSVAVVAVGVGM